MSLEVDSPNGWCFGTMEFYDFIGIYGFLRFLFVFFFKIWFLCGFNMVFISFLYGFYMVYMVYMVYIIWFIWNILGRYFPMMVILYWYGNIPSGKRLRSYGSHGPFIDGNIMGIYDIPTDELHHFSEG